MGYHRAGFDEIVGVDLVPQKHYPFEFVQADALEFLADGGWQGFDAIHASPPCQGYSIMNNLPWLAGNERAYLILPVRELLEATGLPYVIENVMGARFRAKGLVKLGLESHGMQAGWLCGTMFGLPFYRHRLFETNWFWMQPGHPNHTMSLHPRSERFVYGGTVRGLPGGSAGMDVKPHPNPVNTAWRKYHDGSLASGQGNGAQAAGVGVGHAAGWHIAAEAMGIDWMVRAELTQAIPPVYTRFIGTSLIAAITQSQ